MKDSCQSCRFWRLLPEQPWCKPGEEKDPNKVVIGVCRRNAPVAVSEILLASAKFERDAGGILELDTDIPDGDLCAKWPTTDRADWCGEHKK